jgi:5-methylcytosine-specific restriction endonuclease McrA
MNSRIRNEEWLSVVKARIETTGSICELCHRRGSRYDPFNPLDGYHRIPRRKGGSDTAANCVILCRSCHSEVYSRTKKPAADSLRPTSS